MSDFAKLLADAGDEVRVITSYPHKARVAEVDDRPFEAKGIQVYRCHLHEVRGSGAKAYLRHYGSFVRGSLRLGWKIWRSGWRPDVIYASSPPLFVGITGRVLSEAFSPADRPGNPRHLASGCRLSRSDPRPGSSVPDRPHSGEAPLPPRGSHYLRRRPHA